MITETLIDFSLVELLPLEVFLFLRLLHVFKAFDLLLGLLELELDFVELVFGFS